ncbi:single-stranded-DNA-specific exonuclease RecJ [Propionivibrio dicarboxylicus]|uniref:Single-stranded-DNA-specific exonuclease RecJ n=1 Tax=Propionivibrio dicarboxylicus TaxID=83767 RepID=A0A1G7YFJ6_9RHOO|nr:single-stranded-DNA-specific exonuclease RecJ [Propionivibrio dicarboxylicus]SDG94660.1 single-stranded-DNA-specific exonuclease [Propionivibrio dicarboxylicus]
MTRFKPRAVPPRPQWQLEQQGLHPLLARLYAARGVTTRSQLDYDLKQLIPPAQLTHAADAAVLLADAIEAGARILIVADYDCDGATACAVGVRALRAMAGDAGAVIDYLVPNRFTYGYGLSPEIVDLAAEQSPDLLVTVDNGIASIEGVARANELGIATLITDHHLPADTLPAAECIVNPNQPGCEFPSKHLAGVGVMFYVMLALRAELRTRGWFGETIAEPNLANLLDLVALGTVADVVRLDGNNRILVSQGLKRMRSGRINPGLQALFRAAGRDPAKAGSLDLGFMIGPRLNAAGRLADMSLGIEALITDDPARALNIAQQLDALNRERKDIEAGMQETALAHLDAIDPSEAAALALFDPTWHQGVIGILASRIKDRHHRPVFAFARGDNGEIKGSGRSIAGLHLRDALDLLSKREPGLFKRFGGHAMAAGATILEADFPRFRDGFARIADELLDVADRTRTLDTDGPLEAGYLSIQTVRLLEDEVWGQGFPPPLFDDEFLVDSQRVLKEKHLKLRLRKDALSIDAIQFNFSTAPGRRIRVAYRLAINEYNGVQSPQLMIEHFENT